MQTQIRNHPPAEPVRLAAPKDWQEVFADAALLEAIGNYARLYAERGRAHQAVQEAERGLRQAALADRDALAAAIGEGTSLPKSDVLARKAADVLAEATRLEDATREAFAQSSRAVERVIGERSDFVLADLEQRIAAAVGEAEAAVAKLDETFATLAALRRARMFVQTRGARSNWVPASGSWAKTSEQLHELIVEPPRTSAAPELVVVDGEGEDPRAESSRA